MHRLERTINYLINISIGVEAEAGVEDTGLIGAAVPVGLQVGHHFPPHNRVDRTRAGMRHEQ